eukprot:jgi/Orpsp1_1/1177617/evm.model.c7180000062159.1
MRQPNLPNTLDIEKWKDDYKSIINNSLENENEVEILFTFYNSESSDKNLSEYINFFKDNINDWINSKYDMAILDDRMLFSDEALIESDIVKQFMNSRKATFNGLLNLSSYVEKNEIDHHDSEFLNHSYFNEELYALPYERDFDLIYFDNSNEQFKNITNLMDTLTWDDLLLLINNNSMNQLKIALNDEDELLNFFFEYINSKFDMSKEETKNYYEEFYNGNYDNLLNSFRSFVMSYTSENLNSTLSLNLSEAYSLYSNKETFLFKGKASHYSLLDNDDNNNNAQINKFKNDYINNATKTITNTTANNNINNNINNKTSFNTITTKAINTKTIATNNNNNINNNKNNNKITNTNITVLPPKNYSAITEKFLVLNRYSEVDPEVLVKVALNLTSLKMQILRATCFGTIPTFDFKKMKSNINIKGYCEKNTDICNNFNNIKSIYLKDILSSKLSPPFFETRIFLPVIMKSYLNNDDMESLQLTFKNIPNLVTNSMGIYGVLSYVIIIVYIILSTITMYLTYKYREHPYLKVTSPIFCIFMILGFMTNILSIIIILPPYASIKCRFSMMNDFLNICFTYIPIFAITYRIYYIFKSNTLYINLLFRKNISYIYSIGFFVILIYKFILFIYNDFYYISIGYINQSRFPQCFYENHEIYNKFDNLILIIIVLSIVYMIIKIKRISTKYSYINYIYIILSLNLIKYLFGKKAFYTKSKNFSFHFLLFTLIFAAIYLFCIYLLVGLRLIFIISYNKTNGNTEMKIEESDYLYFIPLKTNMKEYNELLKKIINKRKLSLANSINNITKFKGLRESECYNYLLFSGVSGSNANSNTLVKNYINQKQSTYSLSRKSRSNHTTSTTLSTYSISNNTEPQFSISNMSHVENYYQHSNNSNNTFINQD